MERKKGEDGLILYLTLVLALLGSLMAACMLIVAEDKYRLAVTEMEICQADWLAEAAVLHALGELQKNAGWSAGFAQVPLGAGTYSLTISPWAADEVKLHAEGRIGDHVSRVLEVVYQTKTKRVLCWQADEVSLLPTSP